MKKPTIEELKANLTEWWGSEWYTPNGVQRLEGIEIDGNLIFERSCFGYRYCTPKPKLIEGWLNVYEESFSYVYSSKELADSASLGSRRVRCVKVREVEDGE